MPKLKPFWGFACCTDYPCPDLSTHASLIFMKGPKLLLPCDGGFPRTLNTRLAALPRACQGHKIPPTQAPRPIAGDIWTRPWLTPHLDAWGNGSFCSIIPHPFHPPANARHVILSQWLQYLPLPISNTPRTSRMARCEQNCLLSAQEFPGFAFRQARRLPPRDPETAVLVLLCAEFSAFHGSL